MDLESCRGVWRWIRWRRRGRAVRQAQCPLSNNVVDFADDYIQSAGLDGCLVIVHHKRQGCSTDLWFLREQWVLDQTLLHATRAALGAPWSVAPSIISIGCLR